MIYETHGTTTYAVTETDDDLVEYVDTTPTPAGTPIPARPEVAS